MPLLKWNWLDFCREANEAKKTLSRLLKSFWSSFNVMTEEIHVSFSQSCTENQKFFLGTLISVLFLPHSAFFVRFWSKFSFSIEFFQRFEIKFRLAAPAQDWNIKQLDVIATNGAVRADQPFSLLSRSGSMFHEILLSKLFFKLKWRTFCEKALIEQPFSAGRLQWHRFWCTLCFARTNSFFSSWKSSKVSSRLHYFIFFQWNKRRCDLKLCELHTMPTLFVSNFVCC